MTRLTCILLILCLTACTGAAYRPLVDTQGADMRRYEADLTYCQGYAAQVAGVGNQAAIGAGIGALLSAGLALIGGSNYSMGRSAVGGALLGGAGGAFSGEHDQHEVVRRCLAGRGYKVLQ